MLKDALFKKLVSRRTLLAGWHLTRVDVLKDFHVDDFGLEAFASNITNQIADIRMQLLKGCYRFEDLEPVAMPKGPHGTRPGSILSLRDRVVLWSVVSLVAPKLDAALVDGVLSFRVKASVTKGNLFAENEELSIPFLKSSHISRNVSPFSPWLYNWREFDRKSKEAVEDGFKYMATTDIAAYFENISLDIMRDYFLSALFDEHRLVNLLFDALHSWAVPTMAGHRPRRGIPQGTGISSFLGNLFLSPLDRAVEEYIGSGEIRYYRYMDDIRVFCKKKMDASRLILVLERQVRQLHLSVQSSKTKVIHGRDLLELLNDERIADIVNVRKKYPIPNYQTARATKALQAIADTVPTSGKNISSSKYLFREGLFERSTRMWMNSMIFYGSSGFIPLLTKIVLKNNDPRYSDILVRSAKRFPSYTFNTTSIAAFLKGDENIFDFHESAMIDAYRYMQKPSRQIRTKALENLNADSGYASKMSSIRYLAKCELTNFELMQIRGVWDRETNTVCRLNLLMLLAQLGVTEFSSIRADVERMPTAYAVDTSQLLRSLTQYGRFSRSFLTFMLDIKRSFRLADWIGVAWLVTHSQDKRLRMFAKAKFQARVLIERDPQLQVALRRMIVRLM